VPHRSDPRFRKILRKLWANHKIDPNFKPFSAADTFKAINASKSSSANGPDGLTSIHLKYLGHYLTALYNLSICKADLPAIWKAAVIVPVLKPSYRPIFLLSPAVKVLEHLLLPDVVAALPKSSAQHGFAPAHSCVTALLPIIKKVAIGFNGPAPASRSALCAVNISKAFNSINHILLLEQIAASPLHPNLVRWLAAYIRGRTAHCIYGSAKSSP
jgi:hypothetical protein